MKQALVVLAMVVFVLAILSAAVMTMTWIGRAASGAITTVEVIEVEHGVRCAKMLTAISCWKVDP